MTYLGEIATGRDNNLNLIRAVAASAVLVSHAVPISQGAGILEPLKALTGYKLGTQAVFVFFAISGFLISMSFQRSSSWTSFLVARFLRLLPGLIVSLVLVAFLLGPLVSSLGPLAYMAAPETYTFLIRNTILIAPQNTLPGVFETHPYPTVEGSIWTLFYEVVCYMGVFVIGVLGILGRPALVAIGMGFYGLAWFWVEAYGVSILRLERLQTLSLPFVIGVGFYVWRHMLVISVFGVIGLVLVAILARGTLAYEPALILALSYGTFYLAYVPGRRVARFLRSYNRLGDYSYGIYVYAFPLQGFAVWLFGPQTPAFNMAVAFPMTLLCAIASWHLVEGPAMALKPAIMRRLGPARGTG